MSDLARRPWTLRQFFEWQARQVDRYELVSGVPVRMMAGANNVHDDITVNLLAELRGQLRRSGCRPFSGDGSVETLPGQVRRPDAGVDGGRRDPDAMQAAAPCMVAEVLSPTTRDFDAFEKVSEYKQVATMDYILMVEPNAPEVVLWSRDEDRAWVRLRVEGPDQEVDMPSIGVTLPLRDIYDGVAFPPRSRLIRTAEPQAEATEPARPG